VLPGLTGWAQVNGRNSLSWTERIEHDLWYVDNRSLRLNLQIMVRTFPVLFKPELIYGPEKNFEFDEEINAETVHPPTDLSPRVVKTKTSQHRAKEEITLGV
jgi:hypothetical protein